MRPLLLCITALDGRRDAGASQQSRDVRRLRAVSRWRPRHELLAPAPSPQPPFLSYPDMTANLSPAQRRIGSAPGFGCQGLRTRHCPTWIEASNALPTGVASGWEAPLRSFPEAPNNSFNRTPLRGAG